MGSFFAPSVPTYSPVTYTPPQTTSTLSSDTTSNDQTTESTTTTTTSETEAINDVIKRTNRGRSSLIQTSYRGVLNEQSDASDSTPLSNFTPKRKTLLGE